MTFRDFREIYPQVNLNFISYNGIVQSVKQYLKKIKFEVSDIEPMSGPSAQPHILTILTATKGTKNTYGILIAPVPKIKGIETWENRLGLIIEQEKVFKKLKITTRDTRLRWLQYRILHNILTTNKSVAKYNTTQDELCSFCKTHPESIEHLFWTCAVVKKFWTILTEKLNRHCKHTHKLILSKKIVILGLDINIKTDLVLDLIILLSKSYIYRSKVNKTKPNIIEFGCILQTRYKIEKTISYKQSNYSKFVNNWNLYTNMIKSLTV